MLELHWSRRTFLKSGGALVVTFTLGEHAAEAQRTLAKSVDPDEVAAFLAIDAKGMVTLYSGKVELGTGVLDRGHSDRGRRVVGSRRACHDNSGRHAADA